jgi:exopolyphosphatase/guanosine-5'-triphosphate,3'-diphosphate pyrophosphatase
LEFVNRVREETGIDIEIINGGEEGRLIYLGVLQAVPVFNKRVLCIDIGGGSTEFIVGYKGKILYVNSLKLGAVRLTKKFFPNYLVDNNARQECEKWIEGVLHPVARIIRNYKIDLVIGSSGTIMAAGLMIKSMNEKNTSLTILNNYKFLADDLIKVTDLVLSKKLPEQRKKIKGLDEKRSDIIPAGMILLSKIFNQFDFGEMIISGYALREGIILDTINKEILNRTDDFSSDIRKDSVEHLARSCDYDYDHCNHVAMLADNLFDQLSVLHGLTNKYKEYLVIAAKLHDIGFHIAHSKHHKHSQYIIVNSELLGYNENEIRAIACIARYHRKSHPKSSHDEYMLLPNEWKEVVKKLSAILRIADAFDRTHNALVKYVHVDIKDNTVIFSVENKLEDIEIELWSIDRRKQLFEGLFKHKIELLSFT